MTLEQTLDRLYALHRFGIKPGLERILTLLDHCGNPHRDVRCIHVAGTNGKGSVCSMLTAVLAQHGLRVGLYTSPHIRRFNERIQVNGVLIRDEDIARLFETLEPFIVQTEATFFEVTTAMAFLYFKEQKVDCLVLETGMGGRFDATNVVTPLVSVITSIDLDHQEYLGNTLEEICYEKAGIIKPGVPVVSAERRPELNHIILDVATQLSAPLFLSSESVNVVSAGIDDNLHMRCRWSLDSSQEHEITMPLSGLHQLRNLACVLATLKQLNDIWNVHPKTIEAGIKNLGAFSHLQARIQLLRRMPPLVVDVGHNAACMRQLVQTLSMSPYADRRWNIVFGLMADKDCEQMLQILKPLCKTLIAVQPTIERAMKSHELVRVAQSQAIETVDRGSVAAGIRFATAESEPLLICGSFYLIDEALTELGVEV